MPRLARVVGIEKLFLKDDGSNPTNSFKDRASAVGVMKAIEFGFDTIACASTGNAASSLAGLSAAVGLKSYIFVPARAPEPKVTQLLIFGATVLRVQGTYEQAFDLCKQRATSLDGTIGTAVRILFWLKGKKLRDSKLQNNLAMIFPIGSSCQSAMDARLAESGKVCKNETSRLHRPNAEAAWRAS